MKKIMCTDKNIKHSKLKGQRKFKKTDIEKKVCMR